MSSLLKFISVFAVILMLPWGETPTPVNGSFLSVFNSFEKKKTKTNLCSQNTCFLALGFKGKLQIS